MFLNGYLNFLFLLHRQLECSKAKVKVFHVNFTFYDCSPFSLQFPLGHDRQRRREKTKGNAMAMAENIRWNDKARVLNTFSAYIWIIIPLWFLVSTSHSALFTFRVKDFFVRVAEKMKILQSHALSCSHKTLRWWTSSTDIVCISQT